MGVINYNDNPSNLKFECLMLLEKMPGKQPKHSKVVVLEKTKMVICNYYGPYEKLGEAYAK